MTNDIYDASDNENELNIYASEDEFEENELIRYFEEKRVAKNVSFIII